MLVSSNQILEVLETKRPRKIATPYSLAETVRVVLRNVAGLSSANGVGALRLLPRSHALNRIDHVVSRIAFVGDLMSVGKRRLVIDGPVAAFLTDCDFLVANLEATITRERRRRGVLIGAFQRQDAHVVDVLAELFPPDRTYLSVANNHAGDFEDPHYERSCRFLEERGFHLFGQANRPYVDIYPRIRLHAGTMWSNQICDRVHWPGAEKKGVHERYANLLFPHWGYELEKYPRPEIVHMAREYGRRFEAILGHHPHMVQPITGERAGDHNRLIAYSLGDFCSGIPLKAYRYGIVTKLEVGLGVSGKYQIGTVDWQFIESCKRGKTEVAVRLAARVPYFDLEGNAQRG